MHDVLRSQGQPLDATARNDFGARFDEDFSGVRIHVDDRAAASAEAVQAEAYTAGQHIVFGAGRYQTSTTAGRRLLAHELTHVVQQTRSDGIARMPSEVGPVDDAAEREAERNASHVDAGIPLTAQAHAGHTVAPLQRYGHDSSCTTADLTGVVWPGDHVMREMVAKAIRVLGATPIDARVTALFPKYFMTATPSVATILGVFNAVQSVISANTYVYECEHDCEGKAAYVRHRLRYIGIDPNLHLCLNKMSGYSLECNGSLILHEMTHYAAHLDDEATGCGACSTAGCPASLSPSDALDNTYSYADFAYELYSIPV